MEVLLGFAIALAIGATGVGGGVITAPLLILLLGMPAVRAVGTALVFVAAVKSIAVIVYFRRRQVDGRVLRAMLAGGLPGVVAGSLLLAGARNALVLGAVGLVVAVSASLTLVRSMLPSMNREPRERLRWLGAASAVIGLEVGFSSAGAGALGTLALFHMTSLSPAEVVGTDLLFGFVLSTVGGAFHLASGTYDLAVLLKLVAGGVAGALAGAHLAGALPARTLKIAISVLLLGLGVRLSLDALTTLAPLLR